MSQPKGNLRRHDRVALDFPVQVHWKDGTGADNSVNGRTIDVAEAGIRIKVPVSLDKGTYVTLHVPKIPLHGTASVRTSRRQGLAYIVGLEFTGGLRWKPPKS